MLLLHVQKQLLGAAHTLVAHGATVLELTRMYAHVFRQVVLVTKKRNATLKTR